MKNNLTCPSLSKVGEKNDTHYEAKIGVILTVFIIIFSKDLYLCIYQYNKYKAEGYVLNHLIFLEKSCKISVSQHGKNDFLEKSANYKIQCSILVYIGVMTTNRKQIEEN